MMMNSSAPTSRTSRRRMLRPQHQQKQLDSHFSYNNVRLSHPVKEYQELLQQGDEPSGDGTTLTFILEVTWPRVALFYHVNSTACRDFQSSYIQAAKQMNRRANRAVVEFWAVSCSYNTGEWCEDIHTVPTIYAYPRGKIDPIVVKRTPQNGLDIEYLADILGVKLKEEKEQDEGDEKEEEEESDQRQQHSPLFAMYNHHTEEEDSRMLLLHPHSSLSDVYQDAMASFLYSIHENAANNKDWSPTKQHAFQEYLDLMHWTLPSQTLATLHNVINDLRESSSDDVSSILASHGFGEQELFRWSKSCTAHSSSNNDRQSHAFVCGFWKLLHISSIGVVEQHAKVMGDMNRVHVSYVLHVIVDYVEHFMSENTDTLRKTLLDSYKACRQSQQCREEFGLVQEESTLLSTWWTTTTAAAAVSDTEEKQTSWRNVALWLWRVHNQYRAHKLERNKKGYDSLLSEKDMYWPPAMTCPGCYREISVNDDTADTVGEWDKDAVYEHIRQKYWPKTIQSPRLVVLDRQEQRPAHAVLISLLHRRLIAGSERLLVGAVVCAVVLLVRHYLPRLYRLQSGRHKKKDRYDIDQYLSEAPVSYRHPRRRRRSTTAGRRTTRSARLPLPMLNS